MYYCAIKRMPVIDVNIIGYEVYIFVFASNRPQ